MDTSAARDERGSTGAATVLVIPVLLLVILAIFQVAIWSFGRTTTQSAALSAAEAERVLQPLGSGRARALQITQQAGLVDTQVSITQSATTTTATVTSRSSEFIPLGLSTHVATVTLPREQVTQP